MLWLRYPAASHHLCRFAALLDYLEEVSENVQKLIQQRKTEVSGDINGFTDAIEEAFIVFQKTGEVSALTWSKVDDIDVDLKRLQGQIIGELDEVAKEIAKKATNPKKAYQAFTEAEENATYWIFQLARVMVLQNQLNILELGPTNDLFLLLSLQATPSIEVVQILLDHHVAAASCSKIVRLSDDS